MKKLILPFLFLLPAVFFSFGSSCDSKGGDGEGFIDWRSVSVDQNFILNIYTGAENLNNGDSTNHRAAYVDSESVPDPNPSSTNVFDGSAWLVVNEVPTRANVSGSGPFVIFEHPITLRSGVNSIVAVVLDNAGSGYRRSEEWTITGTFANPLYRAQLSWDTDENDVDLHLVRNDTWDLSNHCYYANMVIPGMAELDYDDVDGFGPENMSLEPTAPSGTYKVIVKYYYGDVTVNATIRIFDVNDNQISSSTHQFTADDESVYDDAPEATDWIVTTWLVP
jgi:uncharacterized protein YfaP (DUF2135 family)